MSEFNLLDEAWISVVTDYKGTTKLVGMKEFFKDAHKYIAIAGDTKTQDFAVMRFLLAVLHTVFSRYDADGVVYKGIELDDRMRQVEEIKGRAAKEYPDALMKTWKDLWNKGKFPEIVDEYLEAWRDRFYLFDDKYPFYQVTKDFFESCTLVNQKSETKSPGWISFKTINRKISETKDKDAIFSMVSDVDSDLKGDLDSAQLTRWLINYMAYSSTPDKTKIKSYLDIKEIEKYDGHKGWQYAIGAIHYNDINLFRTLLLNLVLVHPLEKFIVKIQKPAWELTPEENVRFYLEKRSVDNLAKLYTDYSRAVNVSNDKNKYGKYFTIAQLPILDKKNNFLECMTIWQKVKLKGVKEKVWIAKENQVHESLWRNFGIIYLANITDWSDYRAPGIIDWFRKISKNISDKSYIKLSSLGIKSDGTASNVMLNEINDELYIRLSVSEDLASNGWISRINNIIESTKLFLEENYRNFATVIVMLCTGTDKPKKEDVDSLLEQVYFKIDKPFKGWLASIDYNEDKEKKLIECKKIIIDIIREEAKQAYLKLGDRAFIGINYQSNKNKEYTNIAMAYNKLAIELTKYEKGDL